MSVNLEAIGKTVAKLREDGRIPSEGEALVQICLSLASAVDEDPTNAALWREYRQSEKALRELREMMEGDIDRLIAALRDTEDGPAHARAEVRADS